MKKQTAVEWLVEQIIKEKGLVDLDIEAAKQMEKEQIISAALTMCMNGTTKYPITADGYYNETYGK